MLNFKAYYPNKLICPCQIIAILNEKISKYTGIVLPWDNTTAYDDTIITIYKSKYKSIDFILFYSPMEYGYTSYKIMSAKANDKHMTNNIYTILSSELSSSLLCGIDKLAVNNYHTILITTLISRLLTSKQSFTLSKVCDTKPGLINTKPSIYKGEFNVDIAYNTVDILGERTINHIDIKMKSIIEKI